MINICLFPSSQCPPGKKIMSVHVMIIIITSMLRVQCPMQFSGPPRNISNPGSIPLCAGENGGSTNTNRVHTLLLPSKYYHDRELNPGKTTARLETISLTT